MDVLQPKLDKLAPEDYGLERRDLQFVGASFAHWRMGTVAKVSWRLSVWLAVLPVVFDVKDFRLKDGTELSKVHKALSRPSLG